MIPLLKDIIIEKKKWLTEDELLEILAISESTPGPLAINTATYIGYKIKGIVGSIFATLGVIIPSFIIIFIISLFFNVFKENIYVQYAFSGINVGVSILILYASYSLLKKQKKSLYNYFTIVITIVIMILIEIYNLPFSSIYLIIAGGVINLMVFHISSLIRTKKEDLLKNKNSKGGDK